jgi:hypothetical protein
MTCLINDEYTLKCTIGTTFNQEILFEDDISGFTALFVVRENSTATPIISKEFTPIDNGDDTYSVEILLTETETALLSVPTGKDYGTYRWGLDFGSVGSRISAMPQTPDGAPYFLAFTHWASGVIS